MKDATADGAAARAMVLKITVVPSATTARLAFSSASIHGGVRSGLFRGSAAGVDGHGLDGALSVGRSRSA